MNHQHHNVFRTNIKWEHPGTPTRVGVVCNVYSIIFCTKSTLWLFFPNTNLRNQKSKILKFHCNLTPIWKIHVLTLPITLCKASWGVRAWICDIVPLHFWGSAAGRWFKFTRTQHPFGHHLSLLLWHINNSCFKHQIRRNCWHVMACLALPIIVWITWVQTCFVCMKNQHPLLVRRWFGFRVPKRWPGIQKNIRPHPSALGL